MTPAMARPAAPPASFTRSRADFVALLVALVIMVPPRYMIDLGARSVRPCCECGTLVPSIDHPILWLPGCSICRKPPFRRARASVGEGREPRPIQVLAKGAQSCRQRDRSGRDEAPVQAQSDG